MTERRTYSFDGKGYSPDQLGAGGSGPVRLTGTSAIEGRFKVILATNVNMVISELEIDGVVDPTWSGFTLRPSAVPVFFGTRTVTKITLSSGEGIGYQP